MEMEFLRSLVRKERLAYKRHAALRMRQRYITAKDVEEALITGEIIEDYSLSKPLPYYLILGYTTANRPIHIVLAVDVADEMVWVITVYKPSLSEWEEGFKRRKTTP